MRLASIIGFAALLGGCQSWHEAGPSAAQLAAAAKTTKEFSVVDVDYRVAQLVTTDTPRSFADLQSVAGVGPVDLIGPGDIVTVVIFQPGSGPSPAQSDSRAGDTTQTLAGLRVDANGRVQVPFANEVSISGLPAAQAASAIQQSLRGRMVNPQVLVNVTGNLNNSVTVIGEVRAPGLFPLSPNHDKLLEVIAAAGGPTRAAADIQVAIVRGAQAKSAALSTLMDDPLQNIRLSPGDQVRLIAKPRKFSTFGAFTKAAQVSIEDDHLSLAGAISRLGGIDASTANAGAVLVFRMERASVATRLGVDLAPSAAGVPVIYRFNMREPAGYFVANSFEIRSDDLIYVPRSDVAEMRKFIDLVASISQIAYDVRVTSFYP